MKAGRLSRPEVVAAAVGTGIPRHAEANAAAAGLRLEEGVLSAVTALVER